MRSLPSCPLAPLFLAALAGCTWISDKDVKDRLSVVDDDGDGYAAADDCNDADDTVHPEAVENFYDGVDQNCAGDDDYDADMDGYIADAYVGLATGGVDGTGELPGGDCDDLDALVFPGADDVFYDGVDQDCAGDDDYDQDTDGYVPTAYAGEPTTGVSGSGDLPAGDCDDEASGVNPGGADNWYDGVDSDCAGNDDFDQDGDGYYTDDEAIAYASTVYVAGSGVLPGGDCNDTDPNYFPGAPDTWYDGFDKNCDLASDWDQDADGYDLPHGDVGDDCDDTDPAVFVDAVERLGDPVDSDCDGQSDRFSLPALDGLTWEGAHDPLFAANAEDVFLSVPDTHVIASGQDYYDSAAAIRWDRLDPYDVAEIHMWNSNTSDPSTFSVGEGQGFSVDADYIYGLLSLDLSSGHGLRFIRYDLTTGSRDGVNVQSSSDAPPYVDLSFVETGDSLLAVGADEDGNLTYARVDDVTTGGAEVNHEELLGFELVALTLSGDVPVYGTIGSDLSTCDFDPLVDEPAFSATSLVTGVDITDLDMIDDLGFPVLVQALPGPGLIRFYDVTTAITTDVPASGVENVAVSRSEESGAWYIAWADSSGDVHLSFGADLEALDTLDWDLPGTSAQVGAWSASGVTWMAVVADGTVTVGQVEE